MTAELAALAPQHASPRRVRGSFALRATGTVMPGLLSRRDLGVLSFVGEQYAVRLDQLAVLLGRGERTAQRTVQRLRDGGLVEVRPLLAGEPALVWLTCAGIQATPARFGLWRPRVGLLAHVEAVVWVRLYVQFRVASSEWVCERALLRERSAATDHVPDGVLLVDGESHAIEVELTVKSRSRTERILDELSDAYDAVVYFTTPATRANLERLGGSGRWPRLAVRDLSAAVERVRA